MSDKKENTSDNSNLFSNCYTMFKDEIRDLKLTPSNVSKVLSKAMKVVEISELKGVEQKKLAKDLVSKAVSQLPDGEEKTVLNSSSSDISASSGAVNRAPEAEPSEPYLSFTCDGTSESLIALIR